MTGAHNGSDVAYLYDSPGSNALVLGGSMATLTTSTPSTTVVNKFGILLAVQHNGTNDTDHATVAIDFALELFGNWTSV